MTAEFTADLDRYTAQRFAPEDAALEAVRAAQAAAGLPDIHISAVEGKTLAVLLRAVGARRVLEIGTLGGYSGVWMARALPPDGTLTTIEIDAAHAAVARRSFERAGVAPRVDLRVGRALDVLAGLEPGFDAIFVDADKAPLADYYREAMRLLRAGGWLLCDNAFLDGRVLDARDTAPDVAGVRAFNDLAAADRRLVAVILPVRDGLLAGVKVDA